MRIEVIFVLALAMGASSGCGSSAPAYESPPLVPVTGYVLINKKPAAGVQVMFMPREDTKGQGGFGVTDEEGFFVCQDSTGQDGCPVGKYSVLFSKIETPDGSPIPEGKTAADVGARNVLPRRYTDNESPQSFHTVPPEGKTDFSFELKLK